MAATAPFPVPSWEGIVTEVQREYQRPLQAPLAGFRAFAGRQTRIGNWWNFHVQRWSVGPVDGAVTISRDVPPFRAVTGGDVTPNLDPLPMFSWDFGWGGRQGRQVEEAGLDAEFIQASGRGMARAINKLLLTGTGDANVFGPEKGLFDHAQDTTSGGNWTDPDTVEGDILATVESISDRGEEYADSDFTLFMDPSDRSLIGRRIPNTNPSRRVGEDLGPIGVNRVLFDSNVGTGVAYLVSNAPGAGYQVIAPRDDPSTGFSFGLGRINAAGIDRDGQGTVVGNRIEEMEAILMQRRVRFMNILGLRFARTGSESPIDKITFTR